MVRKVGEGTLKFHAHSFPECEGLGETASNRYRPRPEKTAYSAVSFRACRHEVERAEVEVIVGRRLARFPFAIQSGLWNEPRYTRFRFPGSLLGLVIGVRYGPVCHKLMVLIAQPPKSA